MKEYHTIPYYTKCAFGVPIIAFDKIDGSNIRVEWSRKRSFYKYGTRTQLLDKSNLDFSGAIDIFESKYFDKLHKHFSNEKNYRNIQSVMLYLEYFGPNSFAGQHSSSDIMDIILIDVWKHSKGWVPPREFISEFSEFGIPKIIYEGNLNNTFIENVENNIYCLKEGVVGKGTQETKRIDKQVWMFKIKTRDWLARLKNTYGRPALISEINNDVQLSHKLDEI